MTDDLVKRLRGDWFGYEVSLKAIDAMDDAADRIEQLTAERDKWQAAFDEACDAWQHTCEHEMDRANKAEAERDRLTAIGTEMAESIEGNYYLPGVATRWRAALKGESNE